MTGITVRTNHVPRDIIDAWELNEQEREEFDYLDWPAIERGETSASFVRYRGTLYDLGEFMSTHTYGLGHAGGFAETHDLQWWDGYLSETFFSAIVVKYVDDGRVIVGQVMT